MSGADVDFRPEVNAALQNPPPNDANVEFKFAKEDLDLLEQSNLLDQRFARDGLV